MRAHTRDDLATMVAGDVAFVMGCGAVFLGAVAVTVVLADSMHAGRESMMRMSDSGQTWLAAGARFIEMWVVMMAAMMLPSLTPTLLRYRRAAAASGETRIGASTAQVGMGYSLVWLVLGVAAYPFGAVLSTIPDQLQTGPRAGAVAVGLLVLLAGLLQLTEWNAHHVACCRELANAHRWRASGGTPWTQGLTLGVHCVCCSALPMAILFVSGGMNLLTMSIVTAAITVERVAVDGARTARALGAVAIPTGLILLARAVGQG